MSVRLYLMQHGEAKPEAEDPERSLTIRGEEETKKISGAAKIQPFLDCSGTD
jgi:phosphohistidine phosphatase SixA